MQDELIALLKRCTAIGSKWVFKLKENPDGTINKYKANLVAKGFLLALTLHKFLVRLSNLFVSTLFSLFLFLKARVFVNWMSTMHFSLEICKRKFT